jgi:hypothetical protein
LEQGWAGAESSQKGPFLSLIVIMWKNHWPLLALGALALVVVAIAIPGYVLKWSWTGLVDIPEHTETRLAWDWLVLLIIPVILGLGAFWFNNQARKSEQALVREERGNDRAIAADRAREDALQGYLDRVSELVLDKNPRDSNAGDVVRDVARIRTLAVLRDLEEYPKGRKDRGVRFIREGRKSQVVKFLYEAGLIKGVDETGRNKAIVDLRNADLRGVNLILADLTGANLKSAILTQAYLSYANLKNANLSNAILLSADLTSADLEGADFTGADLGNANLSDAKNLTYQQLAKARYLAGAILPDGTVITKEAEEEFKKLHRQ